MTFRTGMMAAAAVTVDELRSAFHAQSPWDYWITEIQLDPLQLIVTSDSNGQTFRVPVSVGADGDSFVFGAPVPVEVQYVDDAGAVPVAASAGRVPPVAVVFNSRAESRPGQSLAATAPAQPVAAGTAGLRPGDRPRAAGEDLFAWAAATGRMSPADVARWQSKVAAGSLGLDVVEMIAAALAPGCATPVPGHASAPFTVPLAAASPTPPPGADPAAYALNPLVDQVRAEQPTAYRDAVAAHRNPPTLFESGDLPPFCASGIDPSVLLSVPWYARHALAETPDRAQALQLVEDADLLAGEGPIVSSAGNGDYRDRVLGWVAAGAQLAASRANDRLYQQVTAARGQVAAGAGNEFSLDEAIAAMHDPRAEAARAARMRRGR